MNCLPDEVMTLLQWLVTVRFGFKLFARNYSDPGTRTFPEMCFAELPEGSNQLISTRQRPLQSW